jgi:hypothetical protein
MKLHGPYRLLVTGDVSKLGVGYDHSVIGYMFQRLLTGETAVMTNLENLGITVRLCGDEDEFVKIERLD